MTSTRGAGHFLAAVVVGGLFANSAWSVTVVFQDGLNGYAGTVDTFLQESAPGTDNGGLDRWEWDDDDPASTGQNNIGLIRFDDIFGAGPGQIPVGATVTSATLTYRVINTGGAGSIYEATIDWTESTPWSDFGGDSGVQPDEYARFVGSAPGSSLATFTVNVTASFCRWASDPSLNHGWIILPNTQDGVQVWSSEYTATPGLRPKLTVIYDNTVSPTLVRQPYLQKGTPSSMTICWRTNVCTDSRVRFGSAPNDLSQSMIVPEGVLDHFVTLDGLSAGTLYYYDVGTSSQPLAGGDANHYFVTAPPIGPAAAFTAWIVGDSGTGDANQAAVRNAMLAETGANPPDIYIHVGDIAYNSGTDSEFTSRFFTPYQAILRHTVCWPTLGNHEGVSSDSQTQTGPYYAGYVLPSAAEAGGVVSGTEAYYSFDYAHVHFICLDSHDTDRSPGSAMLLWLAADLTATQQRWVVAFWHHPPYSKGSHDSDDVTDSEGRLRDMRENVLPILESGGVDLVLGGHSHIYERSYLVDGAYDTPTTAAGHIVDGGDGKPTGDGAYLKNVGLNGHEGAVYVVAGHGGAALGGTGGHPLMYFDELAFGSCLLTIDGNVLALRNVRADGTISDNFQIIKTPPGDLDTDGDVDSFDLGLFVTVLLEIDTTPQHVSRSDLNSDSSADGKDIRPFIDQLLAAS